jgi:hypothetical protein
MHDGLTSTKFLHRGSIATVTLNLDMNNAFFESPFIITQYRITTANDYEHRDPFSWVVRGNSGSGFVTLDTVNTGGLPAGRFQERTFTLSSSAGRWSQIQFQVTSIKGGGIDVFLQYAEFAVWGYFVGNR